MKNARKKVSSFLLLLALLASLLPARAAGPNGVIDIQVHNESLGKYESRTAEVVNLVFDGKPLDLSADVPALAWVIDGYGRTMVPVRSVGEPLGATVLWPQGTNQVILRKGLNTVVLTLGSPTALVNGKEVALPDGVSAYVVKRMVDGKAVERTMVPIRFVSEQLGCTVEWDQETYTASITKSVSENTFITRVVADSDRQTVLIATDRTPKYQVLDMEDRVVVDLLGAELSSGFPGTISVDNDLITTVRYAQHDDDLFPEYEKTVRVVLDLKEGITFSKNVTIEATDEGLLLTTFLTDADREDDEVFVPSTPIDPTKKTVVVDAGHGGSRDGAVYEGIKEKDLTLAMSKKLEALLLAQGYNVVMTRTTDVYMDLYDRADIANDVGADIFVSIHANAYEDPEIYGAMTYYHPSSGRGKRLAQAIQAPMCQVAGAKDKGVRDADFVVLRETDMCAVLVETGFMTNHNELMLLNDSDYQDKLVKGICEGIVRYLNNY